MLGILLFLTVICTVGFSRLSGLVLFLFLFSMSEFSCPNCGAPVLYTDADHEAHCSSCGEDYCVNE